MLKDFTDSDWARCENDMKSTYGYVFNLSSGSICWNSKKQDVVAQSTTEAEYIATTAIANQAIWLQKLLSDLSHKPKSPVELFCDNKFAIVIVQNPI